MAGVPLPGQHDLEGLGGPCPGRVRPPTWFPPSPKTPRALPRRPHLWRALAAAPAAEREVAVLQEALLRLFYARGRPTTGTVRLAAALHAADRDGDGRLTLPQFVDAVGRFDLAAAGLAGRDLSPAGAQQATPARALGCWGREGPCQPGISRVMSGGGGESEKVQSMNLARRCHFVQRSIGDQGL